MARTKTKTAPTHYPRLVFHGLRTGQLLSALIVGAIMLYFMYHLRHDHWGLPWTFILLLTVSLLTILFLFMTIVLHFCCGLNPRLNLALNSTLFTIWAVGFSLLTYWSSGTWMHVCNKDNWTDGTGVMVCRIYKALFTFTLLGFVSTICALVLDIWVFKRATRLGKYNAMQDIDNKRHIGAYGASEADFSGDAPKPFTDNHGSEAQPGYEVPEEQFGYDTGYHGAHAARALS